MCCILSVCSLLFPLSSTEHVHHHLVNNTVHPTAQLQKEGFKVSVGELRISQTLLVGNSRILRINNAKFSGSYFYLNENISDIFKSVLMYLIAGYRVQ